MNDVWVCVCVCVRVHRMAVSLITLDTRKLLPYTAPKQLDVLIGASGGSTKPMRTRADLDAALARVRRFLDVNTVGAVGIIADCYDDGTLRLYVVINHPSGMRVCIQRAVSATMRIVQSKPLIESQPHLLYTWGGAQGFARLWFDTLT